MTNQYCKVIAVEIKRTDILEQKYQFELNRNLRLGDVSRRATRVCECENAPDAPQPSKILAAPARRVYMLKANGKRRPLGIPTLRDRIVERALLMAMDPIWESDFHKLSYGFRLERSVHHAVRTVSFVLNDGRGTKRRWMFEGDLPRYFDTVRHRLLMNTVRKRIRDERLLELLWLFMKAGHVEKNGSARII